MRALYLDVCGLALFEKSNGFVYFVDATRGRTSRPPHNAPIPPHYTILGIPVSQVGAPIPRRPTFTYPHSARQLLFGGEGTYNAFVLTRDNDDAEPRSDVFCTLSVRGVLSPNSPGDLDAVVSLGEVVPDLPLETVKGAARSVAAILDPSGAKAHPIKDEDRRVIFRGATSAFAHTVRLIWDVPDGAAGPELVLTEQRVNGEVRGQHVFKLENDRPIDEGIRGWHLFVGDLPMGELFNLRGGAHRELHHFEVVYDLYNLTPKSERPVPERPRVAADLSDPGFCGPPAKS